MISYIGKLRGGSDVGEADADEEDEELVAVSGSVSELVKNILYRVITLIFAVIFSIIRSLTSLFGSGEAISDNDEETGAKITEIDQDTSPSKDFGAYLSQKFSVEQTRTSTDFALPVISGPFLDALKIARSKARLLFIFIPSVSLNKAASSEPDRKAVEAFLSSEVAQITERKATKQGNYGSYLLYSTPLESADAQSILKMLKVQTKNTKNSRIPILAVAGFTQGTDKYGSTRVSPKLLGQHHASPPPTAEKMASWLKALRKRHLKTYQSMQEHLREMEFYEERKSGYKESVQDDIKRNEKERLEAAEKAETERLERIKNEESKQRRKEFLENMAEEPLEGLDTYTLSLRLSDGRSCQRRFKEDLLLEELLSWIDAKFEIDRESIVLTTMNGRDTFSWSDKEVTLAQSDLPRKAGLRISIANREENRV